MNTFDADTNTLYIDQGTDLSIEFTVTDDLGSVIDTAGWTARSQFRTDYTSRAVVLDLSTSNGKIASLGGGQFRVLFRASDTSAIKATDLSGVFDIELVDTDGHVTRALSGNYEISPEVTR